MIEQARSKLGVAAQHFHYDMDVQTMTCPHGQSLDHEGHTTKQGVRVERYRCHGCDCPGRTQCPRDPKGRHFEVWLRTTECTGDA